MSRVTPSLERVAMVRVARLAPLVSWSVRLANQGPSWVPGPLRLVPLRLASLLVKLCLVGVRS